MPKNDSSADGGRQQSSADENNESLQVKFKEVDHKLLRLLASRGGPLSSVLIRQVHPSLYLQRQRSGRPLQRPCRGSSCRERRKWPLVLFPLTF